MMRKGLNIETYIIETVEYGYDEDYMSDVEIEVYYTSEYDEGDYYYSGAGLTVDIYSFRWDKGDYTELQNEAIEEKIKDQSFIDEVKDYIYDIIENMESSSFYDY